jgi:hypothetical protein
MIFLLDFYEWYHQLLYVRSIVNYYRVKAVYSRVILMLIDIYLNLHGTLIIVLIFLFLITILLLLKVLLSLIIFNCFHLGILPQIIFPKMHWIFVFEFVIMQYILDVLVDWLNLSDFEVHFLDLYLLFLGKLC